MTRARGSAAVRDDEADGAADAARNEVQLVGRLAAPAQERELPSGDVVVSFRLVVDRPPGARRAAGARAVTVDTLDCAAWRAADRRRVLALGAGDVLAVQGALRRRFWRSGAGATSRYEVEVAAVRRVRRADGRPPATRR